MLVGNLQDNTNLLKTNDRVTVHEQFQHLKGIICSRLIRNIRHKCQSC